MYVNKDKGGLNMKAVVLDGYTLNPGDLSWEELERLVDLTVYDRTEQNEIIERIGDADIVITNKTKISKAIFEQAPSIKYVGVLATGFNVVDIDEAKKRNIPVVNVPAYSTDSVAQLVFAFLLEVCHHVGKHNEAVKAGQWSNCKDFCFWNHPLIELKGKTFGIIGFGNIGQAVSKIAMSFGMKVLVYNRSIKSEFECEDLQFASLDEVYKNSDVISLHIPLSEATQGMINQESIQKMKDDVILINTARGALIVEEDLYQAVESKKVYHAGLDVATIEPINEDSPLLKSDRIYITPHIGWAPIEARQRLMKVTVENVKAFLNNRPINVVNGL